jgi:hypothetical protein
LNRLIEHCSAEDSFFWLLKCGSLKLDAVDDCLIEDLTAEDSKMLWRAGWFNHFITAFEYVIVFPKSPLGQTMQK